MKIRLLTLLFAFAAPMLVFGQTISGTGGPFTPAGTTSGVVEYTATAAGIAGSALAGGTCPTTGLVLADQPVPATLGYNTEITNITLINAQHTFAADLDLRLLSPNGTELTFNLDNGGSTGLDVASDMCYDITSQDCADSWFSSTSAVQPENCMLFETTENNCGAIDAPWTFICGINSGIFDGVAVDGEWTLQITDDAGGDTGSFDSFTITFGPLTPPDVDPEGTPIDLLACCVDICELTGPTEFNYALEPGECLEAIFYDAPGIGGGPSCKFCPALPVAEYVAVGTVDVTNGAEGTPTTVVIGEGGTNSFTITAVDAATLFFDWQFVGSTFFDPWTITGPGGQIAGNVVGTGSVEQPLLPGESVVAQIASLDGITDGSSLTLTSIGYFNPDDYPCYLLELISGPAVGDYYPAGEYEANYVATPYNIIGGQPTGDPNNAIDYTQFINVLAYDGPVSTALACNDHVNISVDEDCTITFNADMFLEGGPYSCYDEYEVNILIYGNENNQTGNINTQTLPFGDLLGTHTYEITDTSTNNVCWGTFTAEDKLAPSLECTPYAISCVQNPINSPVVIDLSVVNIVTDVSNTGNNSYSINIPNGFIITDLNVIVDGVITGSQFGWGMTITAPNGADLSIWPNGIGGCGTTIDFIADDQAPGGLTCVQFQTGIASSTINLFTDFGFPYTPLSAVNGSNAQGTWTLNVEGGFDINEVTLVFNNGSGLLTPGIPEQDACGNTSYSYSDEVQDNGCDGSIITRTWVSTDASGNESEGCEQTILVQRLGLAGIVLPVPLVELPCGQGTSPEEIQAYFDNPLTTDIPLSPNCQLDVVERNEGTPIAYPHYFQLGCDNGLHPQALDNNVCDIYATYSDQDISACGTGCDGNVKVIRTWTLLDWCTNEQEEFTQLIKAVDQDGPTFIVTDETVSTDPWGCEANIDIPLPWELHDACTTDITYSVSGPVGVLIVGDAIDGYTAIGVPKGVHTFTYTASDCCGNTTQVDAIFTVYDGAPPVAVAKQNIVIGLTSSATSADGFAKLFAGSVDNGSHDGCTDIKLEVRRDGNPGQNDCGIRGNNTYNDNINIHSNDGSPNINSPQYDPDGGQYVKFCCDDVNNAVVDIDNDGENDPGYVRVWLRVWDDGNMNGVPGDALGGDNFNETWCYVKVENKLAPQIVCPPDVEISCEEDYTNTDVTGSATGFGSCGDVAVEYTDIIVNLGNCGDGFVRRRWKITDSGNPGIFCDQTITVLPDDTPTAVNFPTDRDFDCVAGGSNFGDPSWTGGPCDLIGWSDNIDTFFFEDGACYKLVREITVINWCDYDPNGQLTPGDFSDGHETRTQVIKITDSTVPFIFDCEDAMYEVNDHADSDNDGNVCEAKITLVNSAFDEGSENCPTSWLKWVVLVDLWGDGTNDYEYSSHIPPGSNFNTDANANGIPDMYVAPTENSEDIEIGLPDIEGSMSNHKVYWQVTDGCLNNASCNSEFMVVDKKAPTPYCVDLSTAIMTMGDDNEPGVDIWAIDFNVSSFDNCTDEENLRYTFTSTPPEDDPTYDEDRRSGAMAFGCDDVSEGVVEVSMYVWDEKGNSDFCAVQLRIVDNQNLCDPDGSREVAGNVETAVGTPVVDVEVSIDAATLTEYPRTQMSDDNGYYSFTAPTNESYSISASKDVDYLNGVSTLDLVKIQRHLLDIELLDSPYKLVAADVNADDKIKASDLTVLRKLILGVITDLPTNESWRFVDASQALDMEIDLEDIIEVIDINNLQNNMMDNSLVAVKIGDVTGNATTSLTADNSEVRSNNTVVLTIEDREVVAGETVTVDFSAEDFADVYGYQFTMDLNGLTFAGVQAGAVNMTDANVGVLSNDIVTVSYHNSAATTAGKGEAIFTATFNATQNGILSNMISVTSKVTSAEAYVGQSLEIRNVVIEARGDEVVTEATALFQNEPNPFKGITTIAFNLAEASPATITVLDVTGKVVNVRNINGVKGYNTEKYSAEQLGTSGVLYYQLESGDFTATKKMIIIE